MHRPSHGLLDGPSDKRPIEETRKTRSRLVFDDEPVYAAIARGFGLDDFAEVSDVIAAALRPSVVEEQLTGLRARVTRLADRHPLYPDLTEVLR